MKLTAKLRSVVAFSLLILFSLTISVTRYFWFGQKIFRSKVLGVSIESMTIDQAENKLSQELVLPVNIKVKVESDEPNEEFEINTSDIEAKIDYQTTAKEAYNYLRSGSFLQKTNKILSAIAEPTETNPVITYNQQKLDEHLSILASQVYVQPDYPDIYTENGQLLVKPGEKGQELDIEELKAKIISNLSTLSQETIIVHTKENGSKLDKAAVDKIFASEKELRPKLISLKFEDFEYKLSTEQLLEMLFDINGTAEGPFHSLYLDINKIEQDAKNPIFIEENGKVKEFEASKTGIAIDQDKLKYLVKTKVLGLATTTEKQEIEIPVIKTFPEITTQDVNNYGIKELIGYGESYYRGSNSERIHNVALAASKFDGVLISPGEVFSFIDIVGDISVYTGFKQSYVIQGNETVLGDGGGVCQVSTTLFRAALNAGLEIVERRPHSYRVGYYEQGSAPGIDATIYSPTVDLKIRNDTGNYILIQTRIENNNKLVFEFYGTDDGREVGLTQPVVTEVIDAPEDLYIDDPTLPAGQIKQIDYKANGAKVYFDYKVVRDGETLFQKTFYSNYRPWQAKYLRGTGQN